MFRKIKKHKIHIANSSLLNSFKLLTTQDQKKIYLVIIIQIFFSTIDLIGIALIGLVGAMAVTGIQSKEPSSEVISILEFLGVDSMSLQMKVSIIGIIAVVLLSTRTILSIQVTRRTLFFLSNRSSEISSNLISRLLNSSLLQIQNIRKQKILYAVTEGVSKILLGVIALSVSIISDFFLLVILFVGLFVTNKLIALGSIILFALVGFILYQLLNVSARVYGQRQTKLIIDSNSRILESLGNFREAYVRNTRGFYAEKITQQRMLLGKNSAENSFLPYISKYVLELSVLFSAALVSASAFILQDAITAVSTIAIFMAAGTRIAPAVLRIQQGVLAIRTNIASAKPTFDLMDELKLVEPCAIGNRNLDLSHDGFVPSISMNDVVFSYPHESSPIVNKLNLEIREGATFALVGVTGSGKSTFIDVLLGIYEVDSGFIKISGFNPIEVPRKWPGAIGYVPQETVLIDGTIRENIALGFDSDDFSEDEYADVIKISSLDKFIESLPNGLDTHVGEAGVKLSGGQKQRIGIARALITRPKMLILDEATNALDSQTEFDINSAVQKLGGSMTIIVITHRLNKLQKVSDIGILENGLITIVKDFEKLQDHLHARTLEFENNSKES